MSERARDAFGRERPADGDEPAPGPQSLEPDAPAVPDSWAQDDLDAVPPWRRRDRARVEAARQAAAARGAHEQTLAADELADVAHEIRRLAELHADGPLSSEELVAGVTARVVRTRPS